MTIYKYNVPGIYDIPLVKVLTAQIQNGRPVVWCIVDKYNKPMNKYIFDYCGTGWEIDKSLGEYINTIQEEDTGYVWHIFYEKLKEVKDNEVNK